MSTRLVAPMMPVLLLASCNSIGGERMSRDELLSPAMVFTDLDVEEIDALQPQLPGPFRLGIAPPIEPNDSRLRASAWSPGEKEVLDAWGKKMLDVGLVSEIEMLPGLLIGSQLFADGCSTYSVPLFQRTLRLGNQLRIHLRQSIPCRHD